MTPPPAADASRSPASPLPAWCLAAATALAYALLGAVALALAGPPGYASPLYPSAGIALAAVLCHGRATLPGVLLGAFAVNAGLGLVRGQGGIGLVALPLLIACGAALQAAAGALLVRRYVAQPLVLHKPHDILRFNLLGAASACVSPSVATTALLATGTVGRDAALTTWLTWWTGDTLGVLIATPLVLTLLARPRADWAPRRRTVGLPLLVALALLGAGLAEVSRLDGERLRASFDRDADRLANAAEGRLDTPLHALQALHGALRGRAVLEPQAVQQAARWWLAQPFAPQAMGYSERVAATDVPAYEADARGQGLPGYQVFDRDDGSARRADGEVVALRHLEPAAGNTGALGVNALSVPAARVAVQATRGSGEPAATTLFALTQSRTDEPGVVLYQALYRGEPDSAAARQAQFRGVVFVTVRLDRLLAGLSVPGAGALRWCLLDTAPGAPRRMAGPPGCDRAAPASAGWQAVRTLHLGGRALELHVTAGGATSPWRQAESTWLLTLVGLGAASLLGTLLLTVTGQHRRTELAVASSTAELRREITERVAADEALRESEARLRGILDHAPIGLMFLDPQGHILECNPRLCEMLAQPAEALRGRPIADFVMPDDMPRLAALHRHLLDGAPTSVLAPVHVRSGGPDALQVRAGASALRDASGRVVRIVGVLEDIGEHLRLQASERALHRAEAANRAKTEFLSRMSHELRTPLNAMIGFAQLLGLDRRPELAGHQRDWTQQIQRAGWHLLELINETLDLARVESGAVQLKLVPVALPPLVAACRGMVAGAADQRRVRLAEDFAADATTVVGDATRVAQVVTNLLSNAVKYNRDGGTVLLSTRRVPAEGGEEGEQIEILVADTGIGMTPAQMQLLFQPYNRLGREASGIEGTGIGLVISRRLTGLMGGTLTVHSQAGEGTVFMLRLPAAEAAAVPPPRDDKPGAAPYRQRLVHYVEDNETNIEVMRGVFAQRPQIRLEVSLLGLDGLDAIRRTRPDLVLLDMHLPDISGLELLRHLKQDDAVADIPVVVVSADATTPATEQALTAGALTYVTKPVDLAAFLQVVDGILEDAETRWL